jgi:hypothetical protein
MTDSQSSPLATHQKVPQRDGLCFKISAHGWTARLIAAGFVVAMLLSVFAKLLAK